MRINHREGKPDYILKYSLEINATDLSCKRVADDEKRGAEQKIENLHDRWKQSSGVF